MQPASRAAEKAAGTVPTSTPAQAIVDPSRPMHSITWQGKKDVKYTQVPRPMITDPRDVILKITATSICGSDLHLYSGNMPTMHSGDILGHEFMGIIEEVGSGVQKLTPGQRVVVAFDIACGTCSYCQRQEFSACDTTNPSKLMEKMFGHRSCAIYGYSHLTGGVAGGQAEYVRVPFADVNCCVVPDELPDIKALYLSDIIPTSYHGVELGGVTNGSTVAIWGLGPIGLLAARWCQIRGASRIIGIDWVPERLAVAKNVLGIETINFKEKDTVEALNQMIPGGVDVGIECAGFEYSKTLKHKIERAVGLETDTCDILTEMITCVRKCGTISIIGVYTGFTNHFPIGAFMEKDMIMRGGQCPVQKYWPLCLKMLMDGTFDPTFVVTHQGLLSDAPVLYEKFNDRTDGVIKVFLRPNDIVATK